jgi:hypothetical protein
MIQFGCIVPQTTSRCNAGLSANIAVCGLAVSTVIGSKNRSWYFQAVSLLILLEAVPFSCDPAPRISSPPGPLIHMHMLDPESSNCRYSGRTFERFASVPNGGLLVLPDISTTTHRERIIAAAALYRVPAMYTFKFFAVEGGLMSYGIDVSFAAAARLRLHRQITRFFTT